MLVIQLVLIFTIDQLIFINLSINFLLIKVCRHREYTNHGVGEVESLLKGVPEVTIEARFDEYRRCGERVI